MVKLVYQNDAQIRSYGGEKIEFQAVSSELKLTLPRASWSTSVGCARRVVAIHRRWPTLPRHKSEHLVAIALTCSFTLSPSPSRSRVAPEKSKA